MFKNEALHHSVGFCVWQLLTEHGEQQQQRGYLQQRHKRLSLFPNMFTHVEHLLKNVCNILHRQSAVSYTTENLWVITLLCL